MISGFFAGDLSFMMTLFNICLSYFVCLGLVVFHVTASYFSYLLHACVPSLFHLVPKLNRASVSLITKLKLSLYIQKMSVSRNKCYGIGYGNFSLISIESFFKVI